MTDTGGIKRFLYDYIPMRPEHHIEKNGPETQESWSVMGLNFLESMAPEIYRVLNHADSLARCAWGG